MVCQGATLPNVAARTAAGWAAPRGGALAVSRKELRVRRIGLTAIVLAGWLATSLGVVADLGRAATAQMQMASVRVVHASPDAPAVDVLVDGNRAITNLAFGQAAGYVDLAAGSHQVAVVPTGAGPEAAVIQATLELAAGRAYTVMAVGQLAQIEPLVLSDDRAAPMGSTAKVRFVHTAPDAPAVDIAVTGGPVLFSNVPFKEASQYLEAPAGTLDLEVRVAGTDTAVLTVPGVTLEAGKVYTIAAIGLAGGTPSLQALPLIDA